MLDTDRAVKLSVEREAFDVSRAGQIRPGQCTGILSRLTPMGADRMFAHMLLKNGEQRRGLRIVGHKDARDTGGCPKRDFLPTVVVGRDKSLQSREKVVHKAQGLGRLMEACSKLMERWRG